MSKQPVFLGDHRLMAYLPSGSPIVVDSRSYEVIEYAAGRDIEIDTVRLFKSFLRSDSVVIDVGANFGLFSVAALERVFPRGRLYSVEANPVTYDTLLWTLQANRALHHPSVVAVNAAAGPRSDETVEILFRERELGGASLFLGRGEGVKSHSVRTVALDDLVPPHVTVDVVKVDVEGAEPQVLQGMTKLVARCPDMILILEIFEEITEGAYGYCRFLDELWAAGWTLHVIEPNARMAVVPPGQYPGGPKYFVLAKRSLLQDPQPAYRIHPSDLYEGDEVKYGPYFSLEPGRYLVRVEGKVTGEVSLTCTADFGRTPLGQTTISAGQRELVIDVAQAAERFETVIHSGGGWLDLDHIDLVRL